MGTAYCGHLKIFGNDAVGAVLDEANFRLKKINNKNLNFGIDEIKEVFFGSKDAVTDGKIGCAGLQLNFLEKMPGQNNLQYVVHYDTFKSYPDYFAKYLVEHLKKVDPKVRVVLDGVGDGIHKVREEFTAST
jgi:hypothetical protein